MKILRKTDDVIHNVRDLDERPEPPELPRPVVLVSRFARLALLDGRMTLGCRAIAGLRPGGQLETSVGLLPALALDLDVEALDLLIEGGERDVEAVGGPPLVGTLPVRLAIF